MPKGKIPHFAITIPVMLLSWAVASVVLLRVKMGENEIL